MEAPCKDQTIAPVGTHQLQFLFSDKGYIELQALKDSDSEEDIETLRKGLAAFTFYREAEKASKRFLVRKPDGTTERIYFTQPENNPSEASTANDNKHLVQCKLSATAYQQFIGLKYSKTEENGQTLRNALSIYKSIKETIQHREEILLQDTDGTTERVRFALSVVAS